MSAGHDPSTRATIICANEAETEKFALSLADRLVGGDCVLLTGHIGAGKSVLARKIIQSRLLAMSAPGDVPSPTFTLVQTYDLGDVEIWHSDLYRLGDTSEIEELGLVEVFDEAICLVEWAEKLNELTPDNALTISIRSTPTPGQRIMDLSWSDEKWGKRLAGLRDGEIV